MQAAGAAQSSFVEVEESVSPRGAVAPLLEMLLPHSAAFQAPGLSAATRSAVLRAEPAVMDGRLNRKVIPFDYNGVFEGREKSIEKDPVKPLTRLNELRALTTIADAGLLSKAEDA